MALKKEYKIIFNQYKKALANKKFNRAKTVLNKMKKQFPSRVWYHEGLLYSLRMGNKKTKKEIIKKQIYCFKKSLEYDNKNAAVWRALGNSLIKIKKYREAENAYKNSYKFSKSELYKNDALRFLADIALIKNNKRMAINILNKILRSSKRPPYMQLAFHFISYYKKCGNKKMANFWAKKGILSTKIIKKSGKSAYGPKDTYNRIIEYFQKEIK